MFQNSVCDLMQPRVDNATNSASKRAQSGEINCKICAAGRYDIDVKDLRLKQVYPSSIEIPENGKIDIILIHGKAAHPHKTWTKQKPDQAVQDGSRPVHKKEYLDWTTHEDWLPSAIPGSRIFRFGYRGDWYGKDAIKTRTSSISASLLDQIANARRNCVNRPLLFVAHSYGGLVLAKALVDAWHDQTRWPDIHTATVGAVFMGTPFRGTSHLLHLAVLPQIESTNEFVLRDNIESSKADSEWLQDMFSDFCKSIRESAEDDGKAPSIACFYEREPTGLSFYLRNSTVAEQEIPSSANQHRVILVSESSACLDNMSSTLDIRKFSRACDHLNLHRFTDLEDEEWKTFARVLQEFASKQPRLSKFYRENLIASLKYENMNARHRSIPEPCEGTFSWIHTTNPANKPEWHSFDVWLRSSEPIYWCSGKAGSGKSVLLAHIVDDEKTLEGLKSWSGRAHLQLLSFFFWKPGTGLENNVQGLLQSLLYQLCDCQHAIAMSEVVKELRLTDQQIPSWSVPRLIRAIRAVLRTTEHTRRYCVFIDGLDEFTGDQERLLDFVLSLRRHSNVKCCVSSRPEQTFEDALCQMPRLKLQHLNCSDISCFVQHSLRRARAANEQELVKSISSRANGVFLWAALVTKDVVRGIKARDEHDVLASRIDKLPPDLGDLYRKMLETVDHEHKSFLAFYIQCLRAPTAECRLCRSISILTAERLQTVPTSYKEFVAQCEITTAQIGAHSGGLLEVDEVTPLLRLSWDTLLKTPDFEWIAVQENGGKQALKVERHRAPAIYYTSALHWEAQQLKWVHRSAYDFVVESENTHGLKLPALIDVSIRVWRAALKYIWIAPSVYSPHYGDCADAEPRDNGRPIPTDLDSILARHKLDGCGRPCAMRPRSSTVRRIQDLISLAQYDTMIVHDQLDELFEVFKRFDIDEVQVGRQGDVSRRVHEIASVLIEPTTLIFWDLCANARFFSVVDRWTGTLPKPQETSMALYLVELVIYSIQWVASGGTQLLKQNAPLVESMMRYFKPRLIQTKMSECVEGGSITALFQQFDGLAGYARCAWTAPGGNADHEIGLICREPSSCNHAHGLEAMTCAAIAFASWAWSQLSTLGPTTWDEFELGHQIRQHFQCCDEALGSRCKSFHCPNMYLTNILDAQINRDVLQITKYLKEEQNLTIAQAVNRLDFRGISLVLRNKEQNPDESSFWEISSESTKRAAITREYEMRVIVAPSRQVNEIGEYAEEVCIRDRAGYRTARHRYREFIDRAFEQEIKQKRDESKEFDYRSSTTYPET
ncbi:unnamed protein product [Cercospora beticola]|nr:unnamed protein product [Cercospora beticola]